MLKLSFPNVYVIYGELNAMCGYILQWIVLPYSIQSCQKI